MYSRTCHERPPPVRSESGPSWQVAARYRDISTARAVVGTSQKWPTKAGGRSPKSAAVAGTTVPGNRQRGRQKTRWKDSRKRDVESVGVK